jgi:transmembrane sensor
MAEPLRDLAPTLAQIADHWDTQRTERTLTGLTQKRARARRRRIAGVGFSLSALSLLVSFGFPSWQSGSGSRDVAAPVAAVDSSPDALSIKLIDGSEVLRHDQQTRVNVLEQAPTSVALELASGHARFDVQRRPSRVFRVHSGEVTVEVLGTSFVVEREAQRTRVAVLRGRVRVSWSGSHAELSAGEAGWFPRASEQPSEHALDKSVQNVRQRAQPAKRATKSAIGTGTSSGTSSWREPAEQGDFERAYELLASSSKPIAFDVEELLLAADTARLSGHPAAALPFLKQVMGEHADDSRASLAAFTLGGVLMQQLGQPREAEAAYARARELSLNSSLAEDALARQVEAAHRAGDPAHARALASEYLTRYPEGRRIRAVRRFGKLTP